MIHPQKRAALRKAGFSAELIAGLDDGAQAPPDKSITIRPNPRVAAALSAVLPNEDPVDIKVTLPEKDAWNYSKTLKLVRHILAHRNILPTFVRIWHKEGKDVRIGLSKGKGRTVLSAGGSFQEAFDNLFVRPMKAKLEGGEDASATDPPR